MWNKFQIYETYDIVGYYVNNALVFKQMENYGLYYVTYTSNFSSDKLLIRMTSYLAHTIELISIYEIHPTFWTKEEQI